ncbi:MAG: hypothetical protein LBF22_02600 [Deltaproteobacteria bacterium]|nr:hypothetical protein [Deltaproteobacteria bacterium]
MKVQRRTGKGHYPDLGRPLWGRLWTAIYLVTEVEAQEMGCERRGVSRNQSTK